MPDRFTTRVRAAAVAGWWTLLAAIGLNLIQWLAFRYISSTRPAWVLSLWDGATDWDHALRLFMGALVVFRVFIWVLFVVVVWLTLWAWQLRKRTPQG